MKAATLVLVAGLGCACAKKVSEGVYDSERRYLTAWLKNADLSEAGITINRNSETQLPDTIGRGVYLFNETKMGDAEAVTATKDGYAIISYTSRDLSLDITGYTDEVTARQMGEYNSTYYYGPQALSIIPTENYAGIIDAIAGMKVGDSRTVMIPKWLMTSSNYDSEQQYLQNSTSGSNTIYEITLQDFTKDIKTRQKEQILDYINNNVIGKMKTEDGKLIEKVDTLCDGFYFIPITDTTGHTTFPSDTTVYINYTGRRLDSQAFDTTIEKTAKDEGLYSSSTTYSAKEITWGDSYSEITMSSSSLITGFTRTLWAMNPMGKAIAIFTSDYGYGSSGSGSVIPGYAPLIFEIELVEEPED